MPASGLATEHADASDSPGLLLWQVTHRWQAAQRAALAPFGLTFARYEVLMLLSFSRTGAMPMKRVGSRLQVHPTSVTSAVDRLQAQGFVERRSHPTDRRAVLACITDAGRAVASDATTIMNREVFEQPGLSAGDVKQLSRILRIVRVQAGDS